MVVYHNPEGWDNAAWVVVTHDSWNETMEESSVSQPAAGEVILAYVDIGGDASTTGAVSEGTDSGEYSLITLEATDV